MVEGNAIRGSRVGAGPAGESARGDLAARTKVVFRCASGHEISRWFATEATVPDEWECPSCGSTGTRDGVVAPGPAASKGGEPFKSHLAYVKERRSAEDGQALLDEALDKLRRRRVI